jgi:hypothetical protein
MTNSWQDLGAPVVRGRKHILALVSSRFTPSQLLTSAENHLFCETKPFSPLPPNLRDVNDISTPSSMPI